MSDCKLLFQCLLFTALCFGAGDRSVMVRNVISWEWPGRSSMHVAYSVFTEEAGAGTVSLGIFAEEEHRTALLKHAHH